ncbi:MAG: polysaccharide pyruvyl transferase family protein [Dehalococcoidia bacterium]
MARVWYLGAPYRVDLPGDSPVHERLKATGNNTGNLLIGHSLMRHLRIDAFGEGVSADPSFVEQNFDYVVIGASNFLYDKFEFPRTTAFIEKVHLPCVIIGLGAQAPDYGHRIRIPDGTIRMMKVISERSTSLGVRGHFTASVLERLGIRNIRVIGCPSIYWRCHPAMFISRRPFDQCSRIAVNGHSNIIDFTSDISSARRVQRLLATLAFENRYPYILQSEMPELSIACGEEPQLDDSTISWMKNNHGLSDVPDEEFFRYVRTNMMSFFDVEEWMAYMRSLDFVIGSRFHGCLAAIINGIPATIFVHDARTGELCELLRMPQVDIRKVKAIDLRALYDAMDLDTLEATYSSLYDGYIDFLEENRIEHCLER